MDRAVPEAQCFEPGSGVVSYDQMLHNLMLLRAAYAARTTQATDPFHRVSNAPTCSSVLAPRPLVGLEPAFTPIDPELAFPLYPRLPTGETSTTEPPVFDEDIKPVPQKRTVSGRRLSEVHGHGDDDGDEHNKGEDDYKDDEEDQGGEGNLGQANLHARLGNRRRVMLFCDSCHMRGMQRYSEVLAWFRDPKVPAHLRLSG